MKETYELIQLNKVNINNRKYIKESFKAFPYSVPVYFGRDIGVLSHGISDKEYFGCIIIKVRRRNENIEKKC